MSAQQEFGMTVAEITGDSWERLAKDNYALAEGLQTTCDELIGELDGSTWILRELLSRCKNEDWRKKIEEQITANELSVAKARN